MVVDGEPAPAAPEPEAAPETAPEPEPRYRPLDGVPPPVDFHKMADEVRKTFVWARFLGILAIVGLIGGCVAAFIGAMG